jgi:hypothetical protein
MGEGSTSRGSREVINPATIARLRIVKRFASFGVIEIHLSEESDLYQQGWTFQVFLSYPHVLLGHISFCYKTLCISISNSGPSLIWDLCPRPVGWGIRLKITERACTQVLFLRKAKLGFFHCLENSDRLASTFRWSEDPSTAWLVPSTGQKIPVQPSWYLRPQKIPLAENRFLQTGQGAENIREKSRQCFTF